MFLSKLTLQFQYFSIVLWVNSTKGDRNLSIWQYGWWIFEINYLKWKRSWKFQKLLVTLCRACFQVGLMPFTTTSFYIYQCIIVKLNGRSSKTSLKYCIYLAALPLCKLDFRIFNILDLPLRFELKKNRIFDEPWRLFVKIKKKNVDCNWLNFEEEFILFDISADSFCSNCNILSSYFYFLYFQNHLINHHG